MKTFILTGPDGEKREYKFKFSLRSMMAYEAIEQQLGEGKTLTRTMGVVATYYSCMEPYNEDFMGLDAFIEALEDEPELIAEMTDEFNRQSSEFLGTKKTSGDDKKKD